MGFYRVSSSQVFEEMLMSLILKKMNVATYQVLIFLGEYPQAGINVSLLHLLTIFFFFNDNFFNVTTFKCGKKFGFVVGFFNGIKDLPLFLPF